jgi:DNA-binding MarR family transcriptional regulator
MLEGMADGTDPWRAGDVAAWSAFLRAHAAIVRQVDAEVTAKGGIPLRWYDVLLELNAAPDRRLKMQELGELVVLSRTRVSRVVDELEAEGLVRRQVNPDDRRSAFAVVTAEGRRALRKAAPAYLASIRTHFSSRLDPERLAAVRGAMELLADERAH